MLFLCYFYVVFNVVLIASYYSRSYRLLGKGIATQAAAYGLHVIAACR